MVKLAFHVADTDTDILARIVAGITLIARVGRVGEDPRENVRVGVGVGVVEFQLWETV